tara:strand:- start:516 stop:704 length:189 start_codon:yes stop_codon:yes gene_type:complete
MKFDEWMIEHMEVDTIDEVFEELGHLSYDNLLCGNDVYGMMNIAYVAGTKSTKDWKEADNNE